MSSDRTVRRLWLARTAVVAGALLLANTASPAVSLAQTTTQTTVPAAESVYAASELNLRKGPGSSDAIFAVVPFGAELQRAEGLETNDYIPVTYQGITGWVIDLGIVSTPQDLPLAEPETGTETPISAFESPDARVTITDLMLRSEPDVAAEPLVGMPQGALVQLTREGYQNGYITVDYGGLQGWAYADLLEAPSAAG